MRKIKSTFDLEKWRKDILARQKQNGIIVSVCGGTGCHAYGCRKVRDSLAKILKEKGWGKDSVKATPMEKRSDWPTVIQRVTRKEKLTDLLKPKVIMKEKRSVKPMDLLMDSLKETHSENQKDSPKG